MQRLTSSRYKDLACGAQSLSHDTINGEISHKVLRLKDQSILKLFRAKRLLSSARLYPYVKRFKNNAARLISFGIPTVQVSAVYRIPSINRTAVHYFPLEGITLREHSIQTPIGNDLSKRLGLFFATLHQQGIYFRSIHFGNIVLTPDHRLGLIDVADMRFHRRPLKIGLRIRNLRHLFRYDGDIDCLAPVRQIFLDAYCQTTQLSHNQENRLRRHFEKYF